MLDKLYTDESYTFGKVTTVKDKGVTYKVTEVNLPGLTLPQGYVLETPAEDYYYEHKPVNGVVNEYLASNSAPLASYNLSQNTDYIQYGFSPTPPAVQAGRFWGSEYSWGACGPASNGAGCFRGQYRAYFVIWRRVSGPEQTGVTESCSCP